MAAELASAWARAGHEVVVISPIPNRPRGAVYPGFERRLWKKSQLQGALMFSLFGPIGLPEMLIILAIVILIFGANRLPELGKDIGAGIKNFKSSMKDDDK